MSISAVAALLLLSGAPPAVSDAAPVNLTEIEPRQLDNDPAHVEPPVVVPTIEPIPSPSPVAPATTGSEPAAEGPPSPDDIVVTARGEAPPGDPLQEVNITSYRVVQSVDKALVAPVATGYQGIVPEPVRDGLGNALRNLSEPINFLNFLLQFKIGKAAETLGRFAVNTTFGVGGLFDVAKTEPFNLPYRRNGFANTMGFYGVEPGPYFYLPLVGPTTLRDMAGNSLDLLVLPTAVGAPFDRTAYAVPTTVIKQLNDRIEGDAAIKCLQEDSADPYVETRTLYLEMRQREIDALKGKGRDEADPDAVVVTSQPEPSVDPSAIAVGEPIKACIQK
ncbi:VacJ-like lipoprotein [Sphingopyxis fribergensis]|uniref:VacJ-like lipoprotein n=1 Tax=Sphingopyxis fribergensis TaxID=1515612 RepID=A0A0A7PPG7_9SPHN|nr:VacJ family lipoprotein [Sphingopyxis fribergensis]AJA09807.1 VacJ-like lipoprotein [Sphingopyxis fribergensis]